MQKLYYLDSNQQVVISLLFAQIFLTRKKILIKGPVRKYLQGGPDEIRGGHENF